MQFLQTADIECVFHLGPSKILTQVLKRRSSDYEHINASRFFFHHEEEGGVGAGGEPAQQQNAIKILLWHLLMLKIL